jgi:hypothetical protein
VHKTRNAACAAITPAVPSDVAISANQDLLKNCSVVVSVAYAAEFRFVGLYLNNYLSFFHCSWQNTQTVSGANRFDAWARNDEGSKRVY